MIMCVMFRYCRSELYEAMKARLAERWGRKPTSMSKKKGGRKSNTKGGEVVKKAKKSSAGSRIQHDLDL